jgi:ParB/RepB/Spo0J family partition protein
MNKAENPRKVLGKGLNALLAGRTQAPPHAAPHPVETPRTEDALFIPIDALDANPLQPRRIFQQERLAELAQSIRANGIVQPIVVRKVGGRYQLVAGERRWRAAKLAGLDRVPVVVRDIPDDHLLEITLVENIQREDLNAIETAIAFDRLGQELNLTAEQIGDRTGKDRTTFTGFLYAGLMMTTDGPKVLEFNVRLGDPETQPLMHRMQSDFLPALLAASEGRLAGQALTWRPGPSICVVLASGGYPGAFEKGKPITGIDSAEATGATVFQAGVRVGPSGLETAGGRVLGVTASGDNLTAAIDAAYSATRRIHFDGMHYRTDIGQKGLRR